MFKRKVGAFMSEPSKVKSTFKIIALIAAVAAIAAGVTLAITQLLSKKKTKKYYIECDCGDEEPVAEPECVTDGQEETE